MSTPDVLLADIGGTHARFALSGDAQQPLRLDSVRVFDVVAFPSLVDAARHYLAESGVRIRGAVLAVAGRVEGEQARMTNHPWAISLPRVREQLGVEAAQLVNDFAAQAMAVSLLRADDVVAIGALGPTPLPANGAWAVVGAGTGLGVGALLRRNGGNYVLQTEGGHASFAPGTPEEIRILETLANEYGRVSNERLVSGSGLVNLHRALSLVAGDDPLALTPPDITARAELGDARCERVLDIFCAVFGAIAGDLVLTLGAWDGVYLTGGLVPRLLSRISHSGFRARFEHKGRFAPAMATVPTLAIVHPQPGLLGAAALAHELPGLRA